MKEEAYMTLMTTCQIGKDVYAYDRIISANSIHQGRLATVSTPLLTIGTTNRMNVLVTQTPSNAVRSGKMQIALTLLFQIDY